MSTSNDALEALDRFVSFVYWSDDDITLHDALVEAIDDWVAAAAAEQNSSEPFTTGHQTDQLAGSLTDLVAAVGQLTENARPGLTVERALGQALDDWSTAG